MDVSAEHERKLEAPEGFELPDLGGEPLATRVFTSVYYDTPGGSLARSGITLRRRIEHGSSLWQLKLPVQDARLELEQPGGPLEPPPELAGLLAAHLRHGSVARIAELRTRRRGALVARKGTTAEVTVDEVAVMDALRVAQEFVEVEIELREGDPKQLGAIARELAHAGARRSDGRPKVFQALGIQTGSPARPKRPFDALLAMLREQLREILAHDPGTRLDRDPESLHDMRVAVRRTRALLKAGQKLYEGDVDEFRAELKWLGEVLGGVRDLDVLLERLRSEAERLEADDRVAARQLLRGLDGERTTAREALLRALDCDRYFSLLDRFEEVLAELRPAPKARSLTSLARRQLKRLRAEAKKLPADPADDQLHALRKRGKRARYAAELAGLEKTVARAKVFQDVLGAHQDAVVAEARLRAVAVGAPAPQALAAGRLIETERAHKQEARAEWHGALKRLLASA